MQEDFYKGLLSEPTVSLDWNKPSAWTGHLPFAMWLIKELRPKIFVELGTHWGNSYFGFCQAIKNVNGATKCFAVDLWTGDQHAGFYPEDIYREVNSFNNDNFKEFSKLLKMSFDNALNSFENLSIDLLHIDGLHTYDAVKHDFETWLPKLSPGAIVLFHDTNVRDQDFGVWKFFDEMRSIYPNNFEFFHSHGLGVLQIDGISSSSKLNFLTSLFLEKDILNKYFTRLGQELELKLELEERVHQRNLTIETLYHKIAKLDMDVHATSSEVYERGALLAEREEKIEALNREVSLRDSYIKERDLAIAKCNLELDIVLNSTSWKLSKPIRLFGSLFRR